MRGQPPNNALEVMVAAMLSGSVRHLRGSRTRVRSLCGLFRGESRSAKKEAHSSPRAICVQARQSHQAPGKCAENSLSEIAEGYLLGEAGPSVDLSPNWTTATRRWPSHARLSIALPRTPTPGGAQQGWVALPFALARGRSSVSSIVSQCGRSSLLGRIATSATPKGIAWQRSLGLRHCLTYAPL